MYSAMPNRLHCFPPLQPGTQDLRAVPNPTFSIVCTKMAQNHNAAPDAGTLRDGWHLLADVEGGYHFVPEFIPGKTHTLHPVALTEDPRAAYLAGYWRGRGDHVTVMQAVRRKGVYVVGRVDASAAGRLMRTSFGVFALHDNLYLLRSTVAQGLYWLLDSARLEREFIQLNRPDGSCAYKL